MKSTLLLTSKLDKDTKRNENDTSPSLMTIVKKYSQNLVKKSNSIAHSKAHIPRTNRIHPWDTRMVQHIQITMINDINK